MKKILGKIFNVFLVAVIIGIAFYYRDDFGRAWKIIEKKIGPCQKPIEYSLGGFDSRFNIPKEEFLKIVGEAAAVWGTALGKPLFSYVADGALKINLVYDYRQEATAKMKLLGINIDNSQASYDKLKAKHEALLAEYNTDKNNLDKIVTDFNAQKKTYEDSVAMWNAKGGAPKEVYNKLEQDRLSLATGAQAINSIQIKLNALVENINASVTILNKLVNDLNLHVDRYNNIGGQVGSEFQEGEYRMANGQEEINIYQFDNKTKLLRVLTHEFGHALGLEHIEDLKAIMYRLNEGMNDKLTASDIQALDAVCRIK